VRGVAGSRHRSEHRLQRADLAVEHLGHLGQWEIGEVAQHDGLAAAGGEPGERGQGLVGLARGDRGRREQVLEALHDPLKVPAKFGRTRRGGQVRT
jgi:hypothetical protein